MTHLEVLKDLLDEYERRLKYNNSIKCRTEFAKEWMLQTNAVLFNRIATLKHIIEKEEQHV